MKLRPLTESESETIWTLIMAAAVFCMLLTGLMAVLVTFLGLFG